MRSFLILAMLLMGGSALADSGQVVDKVRVKLRADWSENAVVLKVLPPGTMVEILATEGDHVQVRDTDGITGWLPLRLVTIQKSEPQVETESRPAADASTDSAAAQQMQQMQQMQRELQAVKNRVAELQSALELERQQSNGRWATVAVIALASLLFGGIVGAVGMQLYYRKRLHGLRI